MAVLHDLIIKLNDDQIDLTRAIELTMRERQVLDFVLSKKSSKLFPAALALKKLDITNSHLEKICSVLLKKIILKLAGEDPVIQFRFVRALTSRGARLVRHQMRVSEKNIHDREKQIEFYDLCCEVVTRMDSTEMDTREISYYTNKLLALIDPHQHPEKYIKIKCNELYAIIAQAVLDLEIDNANTRKKLTARILALDREARELGHPVARHQALRISAMFFVSIDQQSTALPYIEENIAVTRQNESLFTTREWMEPHLMQAECLSYMSRFREAFDIFCSLIRHAKYNINHIRLASQSRFFKVAVTLGEYEMAKEILDLNFLAACENEQPDMKLMALLQYICYYLHMGDTESAGKFLLTARQSINRQRQQQYNIQLLFFENAYLYLTGDCGEAKIQVYKNLKFLRTKNINRSNSGFPFLFSVIAYIYDYHFLDKPLNAKQQEEYDYCFKESFSHFGGVLKQMMEMKPHRRGQIKKLPIEGSF